MSGTSFSIAFVAGLVSFVSPCVLPIIPGFLAYLAGSTLGAESKRKEIFLSSFFFVIGFSVVFALLGLLLNTVLAFVAASVQIWLARIGGVIIIIFGLYLTGLLHIPFLEKSHVMRVSAKKHSRYVTSFLFGFAFAAGWTPCVGAALGAIIGLAASNSALAFGLFLSYALGLGLPFLVVGFFASQADQFIARNAKVFGIISKVFGAILVILGILVFTQQLSRIADFGFLNNLLLK